VAKSAGEWPWLLPHCSGAAYPNTKLIFAIAPPQTWSRASRDQDDAMLMPTTPETAPTIAEADKDDEAYTRFNLRMLRNPGVVNLFDGCALSVPCHDPGTAPVGLMIAGTQNTDRKILAIGLAVEEVVWKLRG
jgi:Asp-tRNA(Asn)/Glu-tRNA(Gln) amidotransferase A subunit family amidase